MIIERTDKEILIRIPNSIDIEDAQRIINYIRYQEITSKSKASQEEIDNLYSDLEKISDCF